jgi:hypothetical protein
MAMIVDPDEHEQARSRANEGIDDDLSADELRYVLADLPADDLGLPRLSAISDRELRARFQEAAKRKERHGNS